MLSLADYSVSGSVAHTIETTVATDYSQAQSWLMFELVDPGL